MSDKNTAHHRALWISDVHLGSPNCKAKALTSFLRRNDCERLYLVGDIFDGWRLASRFCWTPEQTELVNVVLEKAHQGTRVFYITGNHDGFLRQFLRRPLQLGRIRLLDEVVHTTADGRRLLVLHGDTFDPVVAAIPRLSKAADHAYEALMVFNQGLDRATRRLGLGRWPVSSTAKLLVKGAIQYLSGFDDQVVRRCRREQLQGVICGHTHHAEARGLRDDIVSYNCGDWVESCTALGEDFNGHISILNGTEAPAPDARAAARTRPLIISTAVARGRIKAGKAGSALPAPVALNGFSGATTRRGTLARSHRSDHRPHS